ncbi:MAG: proprotein convertase P-domain-containing protein [Sandaracinaceae bacterium]|nr:proprotein convertase P-domain-containing protein [Sandaracinaceae bacterium]
MSRANAILVAHALVTSFAFGCAADVSDDAVDPSDKGDESQLVDGAADSFRSPTEHGTIAFNEPTIASLSSTAAFHAWEFELSGDAALSIATGPSTRRRYEVDTVLYVYQRQENGNWGRYIARNDDQENSLWSMVERSFGEGVFRVIVKGYSSRESGEFALTVNCEGDGCAPKPVDSGECHPDIAAFLRTCAAQQVENAAGDAIYMPFDYALELCADAEPAAPHYDRLCALATQPTFCDQSLEEFHLGYLQDCRRQVQDEVRSASCVFGERFQPLREGLVRGVITVARSQITPANVAALSSLAGQQLVLAVKASAHDDVTSPADAITRPDGDTVYVYELWDATARRSFTAYEFGAGDNSFGLIFDYGTTTVASRINDGDFYDCVAHPGPEMKDCALDSHCAEGLRCTGMSEALSKGVCLDPRVAGHASEGASCGSAEGAGCPLNSGLWCAHLSYGTDGVCHEAWQQATFDTWPQLAVPDNSAAGATAQIATYGLATVDTDVAVQMWIGHPRTTDLIVTLVNPGGTERVIWDGPSQPASAAGTSLEIDQPVGFSGDESVNGVWTLRVADVRRGQTGGVLSHFKLFVASRWD